ncbi:MAG: c-type cytochrome [Cyanobacteria bacterium REEB67]|nr:c-type cytochrome [Cyanobacteria bacterium REEB67]
MSKNKAVYLSALAIGFAALQATFGAGIARSDGDGVQQPQLILVKTTGYVPTPMTRQARIGAHLFEALNCQACHSIHNVGGTLGPMLDGIGARHSEEYLKAKFSDSKEARDTLATLTHRNPDDTFLHVRISPASANAIVAFLRALPEPKGGFVVEGHSHLAADIPPVNEHYRAQPVSRESIIGQKLFNDSGCMACHSVGGEGGWLGPVMDGVGGRRDRDYLVAHITNPREHSLKVNKSKYNVMSQMTQIKLAPDQIERIADYLQTLPNDSFSPSADVLP